MATGRVTHGWLGLEGVTAKGRPAGVRVETLATNSALAEAGVVPGDLIVSLDGTPVTSLDELQAHLYVLQPGTHVRLGVLHDATKVGPSRRPRYPAEHLAPARRRPLDAGGIHERPRRLRGLDSLRG